MAEQRATTIFDTGQQYLGSVYAKALLGATEKVGNTETVVEELESVVDDVLAKLPKLAAALEAPRVPWEAKASMLDEAFSGKMTSELLRFLKVVARRGRFDCLPAIARSARQQLNFLRNRVRVDVKSAAELDAETEQLVSARLREALGKDVEMVVQVDPQLLGGLVVRVGDTVYDGSVSGRLRRLKDNLKTNTALRIRENLERFAGTE